MTTKSGITRSKVCVKCERDMLIDAYRKSGRGYSKACRECEGGGSVKVQRRSADSQSAATPEPVKLNGHLEVASGLGFRASIEDGTLQLEQDRVCDDGETYTHSVSLAPHEARQLIDFIAEQVKAA